MTGPAGVVERDGNLVLRDGRGVAIMIGPLGTIESLCSGGRELIDSVAPVIVTDDKWRNFDTENLQHRVEMDGSVKLTGQRSYGQQILEFTQTIRLINGRLRVQYHWLAKTPIQLRAFRQSVRFSPRVFGGMVMNTGKDQICLPEDAADDPNLATGITTATLPIDDRESITVDLPQASQLIDDRYYNGSGYLLIFYPIAGEVAEGRRWSYTVEIAVNRSEAVRSTND